jgi:hypothetical protein
MMCRAMSSIRRISSSHGIAPWSKNQANHSRSPSPPGRLQLLDLEFHLIDRACETVWSTLRSWI